MGDKTWLTVGRITGVHGLAGKLKVWSFAHSAETFSQGRQVILADEGEQGGQAATIIRATGQKKGLLLTLAEVTTREAAESLLGKEILMDRSGLPEPEEDSWYWEDLIGLEVVDTQLGSLGKVDHLFPTGADDILSVKDKTGRETLIPLNRHFVDNVDIGAGILTTTLPQGLVEE